MYPFPTFFKHTGKMLRDRGGNVALMTALVTPVILLGMVGGVNVTMALSMRRELVDAAQLACNRAVKPLRMKILTDDQRRVRATESFDTLVADSKMNITERTVTAGWLTASITATANIPTLFNDDEQNGYTTTISVTCNGLPPFPKKNDVILSSNFERPDGDALPMKYGNWGVYNPTEFGWEGGTGPGVEIQDWKLNPGFGNLPAASKSKYVVELDSHDGPANNPGNSSMYKTVELHKGIYRFSFWYFGRQADAATNTIAVYLEGSRPVSAKVKKLNVARPRSDGWVYESFEIRVETYSLYKLWIAAEGTDDTTGGNFNDMKLEYIKRPNEMS